MWYPLPRGLGGLRGHSLLTAYMIVGGASYLMFGYDQACIGTLSSYPAYLEAIQTTDSLKVGWVIAFFAVGATLGSIIAAIAGYIMGRRWMIFIGCILITIGSALQAASFGLVQILIGRLVGGVGVGLVSVSVPVLLSEIAKPNQRGALVAYILTVGVTGIAVADWFDYGMIKNQTNGQFVWRFPVAFQGFFGLVPLALIFLVPESPRWLLAHGMTQDGLDVLERLRGTEAARDEWREIQTAIEIESRLEKSGKGSLLVECLLSIFWDTTDLRIGRRLRLCIAVGFLQEMSGLNIIVAYTSPLFQLILGFSPLKATLVAAIIQTVWIFFMTLSIFAIERFGRRYTMIFGSTICTLGMIGFTIAISDGSTTAGWAGMVMLIIFYFGFSFTLPVTWVYPAEVMPVHMRHIGEGIGGLSSWLFTFLTVFTGPISLDHTGWKIFVLYIIFNALAVPFAYFLMVETNHQTLEQIDFAFGSVPSVDIQSLPVSEHDQKEEVSRDTQA